MIERLRNHRPHAGVAPAMVALVSLAVACGGGQGYPAARAEPPPQLPEYRPPAAASVPTAPRQAPPPMLEDRRLPPPPVLGPSCARVAIGPTEGRPRPIDYFPIYPIEMSQDGRAAEGVRTQARRAVRCFFPGYEAVDIALRRDEQHRQGGLATAVVGVRGAGCETHEVELELQVDWPRKGTRLDVRRSTVPRPSRSDCPLAGGWKSHAAQLAPWHIEHADRDAALGLAILVYSAFHPSTARTAGCVLGQLRELMAEAAVAAEQGAAAAVPATPPGADGRLHRAGLRILQQLLRVEPGMAQLVSLTQMAASEFALGLDAERVREAVESSPCFGAR